MDYCVFCGSEIEETDEVCPSCGAEVLNRKPESMIFSDVDSYEITEDGMAMTGTFLLPRGAANDKRYSVLSSLGFMGSLFVLSIPVLGQLVALIWALGGCANRNRRNLARAAIYLQLLIIAACIVIYLLLSSSSPSTLDAIFDKLEYLIF